MGIRAVVAGVALVGAALGIVVSGVAAAQTQSDEVKVLYHLNEGIDQAARALNNIRNHLSADPKAKIQVVTHGRGIDFLLKGATKPNGSAFSNDIEELSLRGIDFKVCRNTLETRALDPSRVVPEGRIVPSGVAEVARLQAREGYVYLRP